MSLHLDAAPESLGRVAYAWSVFAVTAAAAAAVAVSKGRSAADRFGSAAPQKGDQPALAFYTLCVFQLALLFGVMVLYGVLTVVHVALDAVFRGNPFWMRLPSVQAWMHGADWALGPGVAFGFLSRRLWGAHALVLTGAMIAVLVGALLMNPNAKSPKATVRDEFERTAFSTLLPVVSVLYAMVVVRDARAVSKIDDVDLSFVLDL